MSILVGNEDPLLQNGRCVSLAKSGKEKGGSKIEMRKENRRSNARLTSFLIAYSKWFLPFEKRGTNAKCVFSRTFKNNFTSPQNSLFSLHFVSSQPIAKMDIAKFYTFIRPDCEKGSRRLSLVPAVSHPNKDPVVSLAFGLGVRKRQGGAGDRIRNLCCYDCTSWPP